VLCRARFTIGGFVSLSILLALFLSCNEGGRHGIPAKLFDELHFHKTLTMLFDGVPPIGGETAEGGPIDPNSENARRRSEAIWYVHEPYENCDRQCHGNRQQRTFSREVRLTDRIPGLCYDCHDSLVPTSLDGWVHGPVAAGECLLCHEPHKTNNPHLLKRPIPQLCAGCHKEMAVEESALDRPERGHLQCNGCHEGHVGSADHLKAGVPELCYECHESLDPIALEGYVHGPVAMGACLYCHEPHETKEEHRLREPIPELCYGCHGKADINSVRDHREESYFECNNCHEGHTSPEEYFLKPGWEQGTVNELKEPESVAGPSEQ